MKKVRITVLKKCADEALARRYLTDGEAAVPCPLLEVGDTFLYEGGAQIPEGFCPWAWIDIYDGVKTLHSGGTFAPWNNRDGEQVVCCTDGIRPVVFLLQAVEG